MDLELDKEYYYVCPFVFTIEKVFLEFNGGIDRTDGYQYYIESTGAYLREDCVFLELAEARANAFSLLNKFYSKKRHEITNIIPERMED
ncbi:MAG TPA: hypothetical protein ENI61_01115 [Ignavibacteria bacterium]|nr:hypothetical protein [Ignavibacteria bacterium]